MNLGGEDYEVSLELEAELADLSRWRALEPHGRWTAEDGGIVGEWLEKSPSIFFDENISGDYVWQVAATRLEPDAAFIRRFDESKWGRGQDPARTYNFNFWLRADSPDGGDFLRQYPAKLGTGWNGMGDDFWLSYFNTVVWGAEDSWVRLRRGPGYEMVEDVHGALPLLGYGERHEFTFILRRGRVRFLFDGRPVYDHEDPEPHEAGHIGLCVWLCRMRFDRMRLYRFS